jgi:hypothetical protein
MEVVEVRMFPDYADTVLWCPHPVDYADSGLEPDLIEQLRAWEASYYAGLDHDHGWRDPEDQRAFAAEGRRLARLVAGALGDDFQVRIDDEVIRSRHPGRSPEAATAFRIIAEAEQAERNRIRRLESGGAGLEWRA